MNKPSAKFATYLQKLQLKIKLHCNNTTFRLALANLLLTPIAYNFKINLTKNPEYIPVDLDSKTIFYNRIFLINLLTSTYIAGFFFLLIVFFQVLSLIIFLKPFKPYKFAKSIWFALFFLQIIGLNIYSVMQAINLLGG